MMISNNTIYRKGSETAWFVIEPCGDDTNGVHLAVNANGTFGVLRLNGGGYNGDWQFTKMADYESARRAFYHEIGLG